jgi:hypothetical protein
MRCQSTTENQNHKHVSFAATMSDPAARPRPDLDPNLDPRARAFIAPSVAMGSAHLPNADMPLEQIRTATQQLDAMYDTVFPTILGVVPFGSLKCYTVDIAVEGLSCLFFQATKLLCRP